MITPEKRTRPLPPGGLERARRAAQHRKRVALGSGGGGAAAVLVVIALLTTTGGAGRQSLQIADDPTPTASSNALSEASPSPSREGEPSAPPETEPLEGEEGPSSGPDDDPDCVNNDCNEDLFEENQSSPETAPPRRPFTEQPTSSFETQTTCIDAGGGAPVHGSATCVMTGDDVTARAGETITIPMRLCVASNASGPVAFHFPSGGEHDVLVRGDGGLVWSFAETVTFTGSEHSVELLPRQCRGYTTTWNTSYSDGTPLEPGDYQVNPRSLADTRGGRAWPENQKGLPFFTLTITV